MTENEKQQRRAPINDNGTDEKSESLKALRLCFFCRAR
jgi:hypothetical protein